MMTTEYTPTINDVREMWAEYQDTTWGGGEAHFEEFDRFVRSVQAKAFDEGFDQGHYVNDSEDRDCGCRENPYL